MELDLPDRVVITGATGLLGIALSNALTRAGVKVVPVSRRPVQGGIRWNPEAGRLDRTALEGTAAVVHLAGESIAAGRWTPRRRQAIRNSRIDGTELIARTMASLADPPRLLISASAVGIYGDRSDEILDENSAPGNGFLAETGVAWEAAAQPARDIGLRVIHPRFGVVVARQGGALSRIALPFRLGLGGRLGSGSQWMSWISIDDAVGALLFLLSSPTLTGPVNLTSPSPITNADFTKALAGALGRPSFLAVPGALLSLALGGMADELLLASQRAVPARLLQAGFGFRHGDIELALEAALAGSGNPDGRR